MSLPKDDAARKALTIVAGVLDYFPDALAAVAEVSRIGNEQHNPGQPLHWSRGKSSNHAESLVHHLFERGGLDTDGARHSAKVAWRALAMLQEELEAAGAPLPRGATPRLEMTQGTPYTGNHTGRSATACGPCTPEAPCWYCRSCGVLPRIVPGK